MGKFCDNRLCFKALDNIKYTIVVFVVIFVLYLILLTHQISHYIGGSRGRARRTPPTGPNSFVFAYNFAKKCLCQRSTPPMGNPGSATALGEIYCTGGALADQHTKFLSARHPTGPNSFVFIYQCTFSLKITHVGGPRPPKTGPRTPTGNPGSVPGAPHDKQMFSPPLFSDVKMSSLTILYDNQTESF